MDKQVLIKQQLMVKIEQKICADILASQNALRSTKELASSEEFKAESKWDTRGIEAGYLAGAQERRVKELEIELITIKALSSNLRTQESVNIGAIIWTNDRNYFITSQSGGFDIQVDSMLFKVISFKSPIYKKLLNEEIDINEIW